MTFEAGSFFFFEFWPRVTVGGETLSRGLCLSRESVCHHSGARARRTPAERAVHRHADVRALL